MTSKTRCTRFLVLATGLAAASRQVGAIEPSDVLVFSKEPVSVRPQLGISETFNDNIFYQPDGESDFITTISPGVNILLGKEKNSLELDYRFAQHFYADNSHLNSGEHFIDFRNRFQAQRLSLNGNDQFQFLSSPVGIVEEFKSGPVVPAPGPAGQPSTTTTPTPTPTATPAPDVASPARGTEVVRSIGARNVDRTAQYHSYNLGYAITEKTAVYFQGLYTDTDYEQGVGLYDLNTFRTTAGFGFRALPKTSFFGEVYYGQTATEPNFPAPKNPHSDFVGGFIGVRGQFTEKLTGVAKLGYESRWFSDDSSAPSSPVVDLSLSQRFTDKTSASLSYSRVNDVSVQFARESYTADIVSAQISQALGTTGKWFASVGGSYGLYDYQSLDGSSDRSYNRYSANFNLAYRIQVWLTANLGYSFESISSDSVGSSGYDVNRVNLSLAVGY